MLAAQADLKKAEADLWPKISIEGFFGVQRTSSGVIASGNPVWFLTSSIAAPLLNFGRLHSAVDAASARSKEAMHSYENITLLALQEAKTALSDYLNGVNAVNQQTRALKHRQNAVRIAKERFKRGLTDMTELTTAQTELDQATLAMIEKKTAAAIAYIRLYKALGTRT